VTCETDRAAIASVGGDLPSARATWLRPSMPREPVAAWSPQPAGKPAASVAGGALGRGTRPGSIPAAPLSVGYNVVVGQQPPATKAAAHEPEIPYPRRHVLYAENAAAFLRSIARRDRLFEDVADDRELKTRLCKSLDACADLLEQIRRRNRR